jgi:hypothetical protein
MFLHLEQRENAQKTGESQVYKSTAAAAYAPDAAALPKQSDSAADVLPAITLSDFTADADSVNGELTASGLPPASDSGRKGWTYLIDEAATFNTDQGPLGAPHDSEQFKQLAEQTRGTPDQIFVQSSNGDNSNITMYRIADGQVTDFGTYASQGLVADLKDLVSMAPANNPVALIISSHGDAGGGLAGDNGTASLDELSKAIQDGSALAGRTDKLDLLSLDSCVMANAKVLEQLNPLAQTIVAAETIESVGMQFTDSSKQLVQGQSIYDSLNNLLQKPPASGLDVGNEILSQSLKDCPPDANLCGADTLAVINTAAGEKFSQALSDFGDALKRAATDSSNIDTIDNAILGSPEVTGSPGTEELRDLKSFVSNIQTAISDGRLSDADGTLSSAAQKLLEAHDSYAPSVYNIATVSRIDSGYSENSPLNGISVFLPQQAFSIKDRDDSAATRNVDAAIRTLNEYSTQITDIAQKLEDGNTTPQDASERAQYSTMLVQNYISDLRGPQAKNDLQQFSQITQSLLNQSDSWDLNPDTLRSIANAATNDFAVKLQQTRDDVIKDETSTSLASLYQRQDGLHESPGWQDFVTTMRGSLSDQRALDTSPEPAAPAGPDSAGSRATEADLFNPSIDWPSTPPMIPSDTEPSAPPTQPAHSPDSLPDVAPPQVSEAPTAFDAHSPLPNDAAASDSPFAFDLKFDFQAPTAPIDIADTNSLAGNNYLVPIDDLNIYSLDFWSDGAYLGSSPPLLDYGWNGY